MTRSPYVLAEIVDEAMIPKTAPLEPTSLIEALQKFDNAGDALLQQDDAEALFIIFNSEFGYFPRHSFGSQSLDQTARYRWAGLLRWLMREIKAWDPSDDPKSCTLAAILITAQALDAEGVLWNMMPANCNPPQALIDRFKTLVQSFTVSFSAVGEMPEPIWEREAVDRFTLADVRGDWAEICRSIRLFERSLFFVSLALRQPVRCLYYCGLEHLVDAVKDIRQVIVAVQVASVLPSDKRLNLAAASINPYVEFGCVFQTLSAQHPIKQLSTAEQKALTDTLLKVAHDEQRWTSWMRAFNTYPNRHPTLQEPLGVALASAPEPAVAAFINAILLTTQPAGQDLGRSSVANCLRAFRQAASPDRRTLLWKCAHDRWISWDFDKAGPHANLLGISWSQLDYAVVGFACEVMSEADRVAAIVAIKNDLQNLDLQWFAFQSDINDAWNRLLSRFQPYAYAAQIALAEAEWLAEGHVLLPFDPSTNNYAKTKYKMTDFTPSGMPSNASD